MFARCQRGSRIAQAQRRSIYQGLFLSRPDSVFLLLHKTIQLHSGSIVLLHRVQTTRGADMVKEVPCWVCTDQ